MLPDDCTFEVFYAEEHIMGAVGSLLNLTHSGLIMKHKDGMLADDVPTAMTFQYFGISFGPDVLLPRITLTEGGATLEWRNDSMICYSPSELPAARWEGAKQRVGSLSGRVFNSWAEWVAQYVVHNPGYQMWDVWDDLHAARAFKYLHGCKCDEFAEAALVQACLWVGGCG